MYLAHILSVVSHLIKEDSKIVAQQTTSNFKKLFRL
jgi:Tat protein secretion system quality control protein TatD with DNase activity